MKSDFGDVFGDKKAPVGAGAVVGVMVLGGGWLKFGVGLDEGGIIGFWYGFIFAFACADNPFE